MDSADQPDLAEGSNELAEPAGPDRPDRPLKRRLVGSLASMVVIGLGIHFLLPQLAGLRATGQAIAQASWWLYPVLLLLEAASLVAYGAMVYLLMRRAGLDVTLGYVTRACVVGNGVGRALPGGSGTAMAIQVASYRARGHDPVSVGTAMWATGVLSSAVLGLMLPLGALIGFFGGNMGKIGVSVGIMALFVVAVAILLPVLLRDPTGLAQRVRGVVAWGARGPLRRRLDLDAIEDGVQRGAEDLRGLAADRPTMRRAVGLATANWGLDVMVVMVLALTVGRGTPLTAVLLAYVVAQIANAVPLTPGGVGIVETAMIAALVGSGAPAAAATATVLGWRIISHWIPIPVGLALMPTITGVGPGGPRDDEAVDDNHGDQVGHEFPGQSA